MIELIQENRIIVIVVGVVALIAINYELFSPLWKAVKKVRKTSPSDRLSLYNCLIKTQDLLVKCGIDRTKLDEMTLSEVADVATTGNYEENT
tara:strand:+ start:413 stop:688 length:276 start_codon:yes stop_codon:yes gene_type:complete